MWWLLGIGGAYLGYKLLVGWGQAVHVTIEQLRNKIRFLRDKARHGDAEARNTLRGIDAALARVEKEGSSTGIHIITSLQMDGLYPASIN